MLIQKKAMENVHFITLYNQKGMVLTLSTFGASIYQLDFINDSKVFESVILTPSKLSDFYDSDGYYGKTIGRFSGRIDHAKCEIHHLSYQLDKNWKNQHSLHGGKNGLSFQNFTYHVQNHTDYVDVFFELVEKENDLPGNVQYQIIYRVFENQNDFTIFFNAISDKDTLVNLTNHTYFNLSGNAKKTILEENLQLFCNRYVQVNDDLIPTKIETVDSTMDFQKSHPIKKHINDKSLLCSAANGYDHCFIKKDEQQPLIAILKDEDSKRSLSIETSYPAVVCYTCNYPASIPFNNTSLKIKKHHAICFECQYIPNGVNLNDTTIEKGILKANEKYHHYIHYHFN